MLSMDVPPSTAEAASRVQVASRTEVSADAKGICLFASADADPNDRPSALYLGYVSYLQDIVPKDLSGVDAGPARTAEQLAWFDNWARAVKVVVVRAPIHGSMIQDEAMDPDHPSYRPNKGFVGKDRVDVLVSAKGAKGRLVTRKLVYFINVVPEVQFGKIADNHQLMIRRHCGQAEPVWSIQK